MSANTQHPNPELLAATLLAGEMRRHSNRRQVVARCRDGLIQMAGIPRERAELLAWRALADWESQQVPAGHFIDTAATTDNLLVIRTPAQSVVLTLRDLLDGLQQSQPSTPGRTDGKPTLH
ncbi:hypothetical protein [Marinimicrobium sp. ARAG 43.8]|uniref:hypothetical protein n=1 Tax=Marinimicrobium sp. ARAG 43.8 TaxID=3418719 RepID=UPI003CF86F5E